ncbi:MAG: aminomethyl-transferring glycine dehydrogenase subunit GcvPA [Armatimonadota bacterium]
MPYIPNTEADRKAMLESIGVQSVSELFARIPGGILREEPLDIPGPLSEMELSAYFGELAAKNADMQEHACFLGAGIYDHYIPATVPAVLGRSEFYTSYTPYQPELSQGNLQSIFEFQTLVCQLTGMEVANASIYDGASALAEAALMASNITGKSDWVVSECVHPNYRETMRTYAWAAGNRVIEGGREGIRTASLAELITPDTACVVVQSPNFFGAIEDLASASAAAKEHNALFIVCCDPISLGLLKPPGEYGADICVAEGQPLGIPMGFGGPLLGIFACRKEYVRQIPGRIVGTTIDAQGRRGYVLTLQTREQHIRRERATSNICSNEALYALAASVYLSTLGKDGLRSVAELCTQKAHYAAEVLSETPGCSVRMEVPFFKEFVVKPGRPIEEVNRLLLEQKIVGGLDLGRFYPDLAGHMLLCITEKRTREEIDRLVGGLAWKS